MSIYRFYPSSNGAATVGFLTVTAEAFQEIEREDSSCSVFIYEYVVTTSICLTFIDQHGGAATVGFLTVTAEAFQEIEREDSSCSVFIYEYVVTTSICLTFIDQHGIEIAHANNATDLYVWRNSDNELRYDFAINLRNT